MAKDTNKKDVVKKADARKKPAKAAPKSNKKPSIFARLWGYLKGVRTELKRVTWPTRKEVLNYCVIVVVMLIFFALFTTLVDMGSTELITLVGGSGESNTIQDTPPADTSEEASPTVDLGVPDAINIDPAPVEGAGDGQ